MSFDGIYTISLNNTNTGTIISATFGPQSIGLHLLPLDKNNSQQKWNICPIGNVGDNIYTIQNAHTGAYVIPLGESGTFTYGDYQFEWLIKDEKIFTNTLPLRVWVPSPDLQEIKLVMGGIPTTWEIKLVV